MAQATAPLSRDADFRGQPTDKVAVIAVLDHQLAIMRIGDMFEPFKRGDASRSRATGGTGLGLTLARAIAEAHDGSLAACSRSDGLPGARLRLRIPSA
ncbi:MAG: ATP-binding protein [Pseudomonadota bacterium]